MTAYRWLLHLGRRRPGRPSRAVTPRSRPFVDHVEERLGERVLPAHHEPDDLSDIGAHHLLPVGPVVCPAGPHVQPDPEALSRSAGCRPDRLGDVRVALAGGDDLLVNGTDGVRGSVSSHSPGRNSTRLVSMSSSSWCPSSHRSVSKAPDNEMKPSNASGAGRPSARRAGPERRPGGHRRLRQAGISSSTTYPSYPVSPRRGRPGACRSHTRTRRRRCRHTTAGSDPSPILSSSAPTRPKSSHW